MDDVKNLIMEKAKNRFDRFGYKKTTMDEISHDCKISKKTIYEYFKDKENLFTNVFIQETQHAQKIIFNRMGAISNPLDRIIQLIKTAVGYFKEDNFLTRLLKDDHALFSTFSNSRQYSIDDEIISIIAGIVNEGKQQGIFRDVDEQVVAYVGFKLFEAFSYMRTMEFSKEKDEQGYYTEVLIDFVVHALVKNK